LGGYRFLSKDAVFPAPAIAVRKTTDAHEEVK
jgi:hypothetical protein